MSSRAALTLSALALAGVGGVAAGAPTIAQAGGVDHTPPARVAPTVDGGTAWRHANRFTARWTPPRGEMTPIVAAHYTLCPAGGGRCVARTARGNGIHVLADFGVPGRGAWLLRVWLEDAAGNQDPQRASDPVLLRFDNAAPGAFFQNGDPRDPRRVAVDVGERVSGVAGGVVQVRRTSGNGAWASLPTTVRPGSLVAYLDDVHMADGAYALRALVRDGAGNVGVGTRRHDGRAMVVTLPVRAATRVLLDAPGRPANAPQPFDVPFGQTLTLTGRIESPAGRPLAGARLDVVETPDGGHPSRALGSVTSTGAGRFSYRAAAGPSRRIRFGYAGSATRRPAGGSALITVPAFSTLDVDRSSVHNGSSVLFSGRVAGGYYPPGGKLVEVQTPTDGIWRTFGSTYTDGSGRWSYRYKFTATPRTTTYSFRVRVRREDGYPYDVGYTRTVQVTVIG